jgi:hypothetical protein
MSCSPASRWLSPGSASSFLQNLARFSSAVDDDALDRRNSLADAQNLALGLPAAAEDAEACRPFAREVLRRHGARGTRPQLSKLVGFEHRGQLTALDVEEADDERRPCRHPRIGLHPRQTQLVVDSRHDREGAAVGLLARPGAIVDLAAR